MNNNRTPRKSTATATPAEAAPAKWRAPRFRVILPDATPAETHAAALEAHRKAEAALKRAEAKHARLVAAEAEARTAWTAARAAFEAASNGNPFADQARGASTEVNAAPDAPAAPEAVALAAAEFQVEATRRRMKRADAAYHRAHAARMEADEAAAARFANREDQITYAAAVAAHEAAAVKKNETERAYFAALAVYRAARDGRNAARNA